jgi:WD40 repeat protein
VYADKLLKPVFTLIQAGVSCKWVHDSQQFLLEFFDTIHNSPSQIYHSALPFSPSSSWLCKCYNSELSQAVKVVKGLPVGWGSCSRTVTFDTKVQAFAHWKETIAVGLESGDIIILDVITGSQVAVFSGDNYSMRSVTFSPDGKSLVSGGRDYAPFRTRYEGFTGILKLWDVQTGGVVKIFYGDSGDAHSVSVSSDNTTIASGFSTRILLWNIQTGELQYVSDQEGFLDYACFSPTNPQHLISVSSDGVQQWDINGHQIGSTYPGSDAAFSMDGSCLVICEGEVTTVRNSDSGVIVARFHTNQDSKCCCMSPNGRLVAVAAGATAYVWDITSSDPYLIGTFIGHLDDIISLTFSSSSSSLISASEDQSVKFWQIGASSTDIATNHPKSAPPHSASIESVSLQAEDGIAISSDSDGVVKIWDISTGLCKASFQTPAEGKFRDAQMIDGRLTVVWLDGVIHIWDTKEGEILQVKGVSTKPRDLRISGDGSKVVLLSKWYIQAWDIKTGRVVGQAEYDDDSYGNLLRMGGSRMCACSNESSTIGWDFGVSGSPPVPLPNTYLERPCLDFIGGTDQWYRGPCWIKNMVTGKEVFRLPGRHAVPSSVDWDGRYLAAGYRSGEMLILDFIQMLPQ